VWIDGHSLTHAPQQAKARLASVPDNCFAFPTWTGRGPLEQVAAEKNVALDEATLELAYDLGL
jgi:ABC-type multidrug transport system ATPase subunit